MFRVAQSTGVSRGARVRPYKQTLCAALFGRPAWLPVLNEQGELTREIVTLILMPGGFMTRFPTARGERYRHRRVGQLT